MTTILPVIGLEVFYGSPLKGDPLFEELVEYGAALTSFFPWYTSSSTTSIRKEAEVVRILKTMKSMNPGFRMILDSGAYSIHTNKQKGKPVNTDNYLESYINFLRRDNNHKLFAEYYNLDIIRDPVTSWDYLEKIYAAGLDQVAPVYHQDYTLDEEELQKCIDFANRGGKKGLIGLGGLVRDDETSSKEWTVKIRKWLQRIKIDYPDERFHALGVKTREILEVMHFEYADASTWTHQTASRQHEILIWDKGNIKEAKPSLADFKHKTKFQNVLLQLDLKPEDLE